MKLSTRLMLGMVVLVLGAAVVIGLVAYNTLIQSIYPSQLTRMEADAHLMVDRLGGTVREAMGDVAVNAAAPAIDELMRARRNRDSSAQAEWRRRLEALFVAVLAAKPEYLQIRLIGVDDSGLEIVRVDRSTTSGTVRVVPEAELQVKGQRPYYAKTLAQQPGEIYVAPIDLNRERGEIETPPVPVVRVATPVFGPGERTLGILVVNIDLRPAFARLRTSVEAGVEVYAFDQNGDYLVHPDRSREFAFEFGETARLQDDFPALADLLRPTDSDIELSRRVDDKDGVEYVAGGAAQRLSDGVGVAVLLMAPSELVLAPADAILYSASEAGLVAIVIAALLAFVLSRTIARPLAQLTRSVDRFDRGEPVRLPRHAPKEVNILVAAFRQHIERERLFSAAVHSSTDAIITISLDGRITAWNEAAEKLFGYRAEEAVGQPLQMLVPEDRLGEFHELRANFLKGLATGPIETVRLAKDGTRAKVSLSVSPVRSLGGEVTGASAIYRDFSAQKRADEMFRLAVDASPAAMIMTDHDGCVVLANSEAVEVFGFSAEELVGMQVEELMPGRIRGKHESLRRDFMGQPSKRMMGTGRDLRGRRRDGTEFPVEIALNPINGPKGPMVLSVVVDITERMRAAAELERRTEELQRSNAELQQFAFVASHDLQEPLRMVTSFCGLLKERYRDQLGDEGSEFVDIAFDGAGRMRQLINDLLDYSRLQTREVPLSEVSTEEVLATALLNLSERMQESEADIRVGELPKVFGNEGQLVQVFQNLIGNALKFCDDEAPRVEVSAVLEDDDWLFTVRDNGIGIDPAQQDTIFGVFQRLHTREEYEGTGIGLAICKRIVETHGGRIWIQSAPGQGASIQFTLKSIESDFAVEPRDEKTQAAE